MISFPAHPENAERWSSAELFHSNEARRQFHGFDQVGSDASREHVRAVRTSMPLFMFRGFRDGKKSVRVRNSV